MSGHTKGSWEWCLHPDGAEWLRAGDEWVVEYAGCGSHAAEVSDANARLIAAAPDLLEALEVMVAAFEHLAGDCQDKAQAEAEESAVSNAMAIIAKAKGE